MQLRGPSLNASVFDHPEHSTSLGGRSASQRSGRNTSGSFHTESMRWIAMHGMTTTCNSKSTSLSVDCGMCEWNDDAWCETYLSRRHGDLVHDLAGGELDGLVDGDDVGDCRDALDVGQAGVQPQSTEMMLVTQVEAVG